MEAQNVTHARQVIRATAEDALREAANMVLEEAIRNLPVGDPAVDPDPAVQLRALGEVIDEPWGYTVMFHGPYAAKQHEDINLRHPRGGGAKYLEHAVQTVGGRLPDLVATRVGARLQRGIEFRGDVAH